jgi:hypothetical protein
MQPVWEKYSMVAVVEAVTTVAVVVAETSLLVEEAGLVGPLVTQVLAVMEEYP